MPYPRPDDSMLEQWSSVVDVLRQGSHADHGLMRAAYPTSFEILVASPEDSPQLRPGERDSRDDTHLCDEVLRSREPLCVADVTEDARWDATVERRSGFRSYCGAPLLWPDEEAFGTLAMVRISPLEESEELNARQLVDCLAMGINAQLTLLYRNQESEFDATHDSLTGLANEAHFSHLALEMMSEQRGSSPGLWMLIWSIDGFEALRRDIGEDTAFTLLRATAERARGCIRQTDVMARIDENRFALLISEGNEFIATAVADRIRRNARRLGAATSSGKPLALSCGISAFESSEPLAHWRGRCEMALQDARRHGGDQVVHGRVPRH